MIVCRAAGVGRLKGEREREMVRCPDCCCMRGQPDVVMESMEQRYKVVVREGKGALSQGWDSQNLLEGHPCLGGTKTVKLTSKNSWRVAFPAP